MGKIKKKIGKKNANYRQFTFSTTKLGKHFKWELRGFIYALGVRQL